MKTNKLILLTAVATAAFTLNASAGTDDGIAASPKYRQQLNERSATTATANNLVVAAPCCRDESKVVASPKGAQQLAESGTAMKCATTKVDTASTTAPANDGIAASPKHRAQLDESGTPIQIAPVR